MSKKGPVNFDSIKTMKEEEQTGDRQRLAAAILAFLGQATIDDKTSAAVPFLRSQIDPVKKQALQANHKECVDLIDEFFSLKGNLLNFYKKGELVTKNELLNIARDEGPKKSPRLS